LGVIKLDLEKGEVVIIRSKNQAYASKPRPAIAYQNGLFGNIVESLTIIPISGTLVDAEPFRINIMPNRENGLTKLSQAMVDKITTIHKSAIGEKIGALNILQMQRIDEAVQIWLQLIE
jgi:mRNA interferase MazF